MSDGPTAKQVEFLRSLLRRLEMPADHLLTYDTYEKATHAIDRLAGIVDRRTPVRASSRAAVFARLRESPHTKADMYAAVRITTLSDGATESDAKRCLRWLDGKLDRPSTLRPADPEAEEIGDAADWVSTPPGAPGREPRDDAEPR